MTDNAKRLFQVSRYGIIFTLILIIGVLLRIPFLGHHPLNNQEAIFALQSLYLSNGQGPELTGEAGYLALTTLQFFIFGASNFMAKFWPALLGICAILLPLLYRPWLGERVSLWLAVFVAMDPVLIGISRSADGSSLAMVGLLAGVGFLLRKNPMLGGISLGAALAGGVQVWIGLIILIGVFLIGRISLVKLAVGDSVDYSRRYWITVLLAIAATLLLISSVFLTYPAGFSAIGSSLAAFFVSFGETGGNAGVLTIIAWLLVELPFIILASWQLIEGLLRKDQLTGVLGIWWGSSLILAVLTPMTGINHFYWMTLPILGLSALKARDLISDRSVDNRLVFFSEALLVIALCVFSFLNVLALANNSYLTVDETRNRIIGALLPLILLAVLTVLLSWGWSVISTRKGFIIGILVLFSITVLANAWKAAGFSNRPQFELATDSGYAVGSSALINSISDISRWNTGVANSIDILMVSLDQPSLDWALRDYGKLSKETGYNPNLSPSLILTGIDQNISSTTSYRGQKILWSVQPDLSLMKLSDWFKWAVYRAAPIQSTEIILWVRNDLFPAPLIHKFGASH